MDIKKVTCWFNWQEWKSMTDDAYNQEQDLNLIYRAFSTIVAWETRDSTLPPALICLKEILSAKLLQIDKNNSSVQQIYQYQSSLAMNIVRFVNFITEPYQTKIYAKPIKSIAISIGLPEWIVNLRHNATHFSLPSIEILEAAREYLYYWLKDRYVDAYKEIALEKSVLQNLKFSIENLFVHYLNARYEATQMKKIKTDSGNLDAKLEIVTCHFKNETFETLLENGFLIPSKHQLNSVGIVAEEYVESDDINIPKQLVTIWLPYLQYCNSNNNLIAQLFQKLVNTYKIENDLFRKETVRNKCLLGWILTLLKLNSFKNDKKNTKFYFELNFKEIILDLIKGKPSKSCLLFLKEISKIKSCFNEIGKASFEKLFNLMNLFSLNEFDEPQEIVSDGFSIQMINREDYMPTFDIELLENSLNKKSKQVSYEFQSGRRTVQNKLAKSDWKLIDDVDWNMENVKLGLFEGQSYENFDSKFQSLLFNQENVNDESHLLGTSELNKNCDDQQAGMNLFSGSNLSSFFLDSLKNSFYNNYWECR